MGTATREHNVSDLLRRPPAEQQTAGYFHTLREIYQQPRTWLATATAMAERRAEWAQLLHASRAVILSGSGSSNYCGDCLAPLLRRELCIPVESFLSGWLMLDGGVPVPGLSTLMISLARSGDSPESCEALARVLQRRPEARHLVVTCNPRGNLATAYADHPQVSVIVLDDATNDRSLVMTSSFTNMFVATRFLGMLDRPEEYRSVVECLAESARHLLECRDVFAELASGGFQRAVFLGSDCRYGSAREGALKMLEMTSGRVLTMPETYLGVRHGPVTAIHDDTLVICFLASDPVTRAYECDVIREITAKKLGWRKLILGEKIPVGIGAPGDVLLECPGMATAGDQNVTVLDVIAGQLLGFFRCLAEGLKPDAPSDGDVISRVVGSFKLYRPEDGI